MKSPVYCFHGKAPHEACVFCWRVTIECKVGRLFKPYTEWASHHGNWTLAGRLDDAEVPHA